MRLNEDVTLVQGPHWFRSLAYDFHSYLELIEEPDHEDEPVVMVWGYYSEWA